MRQFGKRAPTWPETMAAEEASNAAMEREGELLEAVPTCRPTTLSDDDTITSRLRAGKCGNARSVHAKR
jgi:hypothetical protein